MEIVDRCKALKEILQKVEESPFKEWGALGIAERENESYIIQDFCMLTEIGGQEKAEEIIIPVNVSHVLLQSCSENEKIPVIIHTHGITYQEKQKLCVSFSDEDMRFIDKFTMYAKKIGDISECMFIVTDGETVSCCCRKLSTMEYYFWEGEINNAWEERVFCYS